MSVKWLPVEGGIVPRGNSSGPVQEEEHFAALETALEDARGEHRLRRLEAAEAILADVIPKAEAVKDHRYGLLAASAYSLRGRIHWRRVDRGLTDQAVVRQETAKQDAAFRKAIELFRRHRRAITQDMPQSRLNTDYAIALFRTGRTKRAIDVLHDVQGTGVMPADAFAYLGIAYRKLGDHEKAVRALKQGLQLAPGNKVLLETLSRTLEECGNHQEALRTYCRAAIAAGKENDTDSARDLLQAALRIEPGDAQALSMLTLLLRSQGKDTKARELLDGTLVDFPEHPWALGLRAMMLRDQDKVDLALADFRRVRVTRPDLAWVLIEHAKAVAARDPQAAQQLVKQAAALLGDNDPRVAQARIQVQVLAAISGVVGYGRKAVDWLRDVVEKSAAKSPQARKIADQLGPSALLEPRIALARLLLDQKKYAAAAAAADEGLGIAPDSASLLALKAKALDLTGDLAGAARCYRRALQTKPEDNDVFAALIDVLRRAGWADEAMREVEQRIAQFPRNGHALAEKGRLLFGDDRLGDDRFAKAAEILQQALRYVPDTEQFKNERFEIQMRLARSWRSLGQYHKALEGFALAARSDNPQSDAQAYQATVLIEIAEYDEAAAVLQAAIGHFSDPSGEKTAKKSLGWLWASRGWALRQTGQADLKELETIFRTAIEIDPDNQQAKMDLAWILLRRPEERAEGERRLQELIEVGSAPNGPKELVGWCHYLLGQFDMAEHWLRSLVSGAPSDIAIRFDLALVLLAAESSDAEREYDEASARTREKSRERQRGLLHVALTDLVEAVREERVDVTRSWPIWRRLWRSLMGAGVVGTDLERLRLPAGAEPQPEVRQLGGAA